MIMIKHTVCTIFTGVYDISVWMDDASFSCRSSSAGFLQKLSSPTMKKISTRSVSIVGYILLAIQMILLYKEGQHDDSCPVPNIVKHICTSCQAYESIQSCYQSTCCRYKSCRDKDNKKYPKGTAFYEDVTSKSDSFVKSWDKAQEIINKYDGIRKLTSKRHISFEYFCCISCDEMHIIDEYVYEIHDWSKEYHIEFENVTAWIVGERDVAIQIQMTQESQRIFDEWIFEFESNLTRYLRKKLNNEKYVLPFTKNTPGHSTLANVYLDEFPIDKVLKEINDAISAADWNIDPMILSMPCYSSHEDFKCID